MAQSTAAAFASQQAEQSAIVSMMQGPINSAWALLNPDDPATVEPFIQAMNALTTTFGRISAHEAAASYLKERTAAGVAGKFTPRPASPANFDKVDASVRWAIKALWSPNPDLENVKTNVLGVTEKNVLDAGRSTILNASKTDRKSKGWARETEPECCAFCAMLATRGAVYRSEDSGDFRAHDHCRCFAVPVFNIFDVPAHVQEWQQLYRESTQGVRGSKASIKAFRQAYDAKYPKAL